MSTSIIYFFFFFNDTATTEIYTLSLHDALPIFSNTNCGSASGCSFQIPYDTVLGILSFQGNLPPNCGPNKDRKSTRLNSSHSQISYAVFCLKKKNIN